jgi:hypothetical protein
MAHCCFVPTYSNFCIGFFELLMDAVELIREISLESEAFFIDSVFTTTCVAAGLAAVTFSGSCSACRVDGPRQQESGLNCSCDLVKGTAERRNLVWIKNGFSGALRLRKLVPSTGYLARYISSTVIPSTLLCQLANYIVWELVL